MDRSIKVVPSPYGDPEKIKKGLYMTYVLNPLAMVLTGTRRSLLVNPLGCCALRWGVILYPHLRDPCAYAQGYSIPKFSKYSQSHWTTQLPSMKRRSPYDIAQNRQQAIRRRKFKRSTGLSPSTVYGPTKKVAFLKPRNIELKGMDTILGDGITAITATTNTNFDCYCLNLIQQGAGSWNRVGRNVNLNSVRIRGSINFQNEITPTVADYTDNWVRMIVVWDKQPSGAIPTFNQVFGQTDQNGNETSYILNSVRFDNMERFQVLRDRIITADQDGAGSVVDVNGGQTRRKYCVFEDFIKLNGKITTFSGQSAPMTIADVSTGALLVYFRAHSGQPLNSAFLGGSARLRYTD